MSRVTEAIQEVKRYLNEYNVKEVNFHQILYHLNQAQGNIAMREDVIEATIEITLVGGKSKYDFVFGTGTAAQDIIKRVKSLKYPDTWNHPVFPVDQEYDEIVSTNPALSFVQYIIIRNKKIEFYGTPGDSDTDKTVTLQCFLTKPTQAANDDITTPIDFEVPEYFDTALHYYAASQLLPLESPGRDKLFALYEKEVNEKAGVYNHKHNYVRSPKPNW